MGVVRDDMNVLGLMEKDQTDREEWRRIILNGDPWKRIAKRRMRRRSVSKSSIIAVISALSLKAMSCWFAIMRFQVYCLHSLCTAMYCGRRFCINFLC